MMEKFNTPGVFPGLACGGASCGPGSAHGLRLPRLLRLLCAGLLVCVLASCSAIRFGYGNADTIVYWWLDSYVDLNASQAPLVRQEIASLLAWHRKTQLRDYAQLLARLQKRLQGPVSAAELMDDMEEIQKRPQVLLQKVTPALAELAISLQPEQLLAIQKKFDSNNEDYHNDYLRGDMGKWQKLRYERLLEQAEYWFGDFNREQQQKIRKASDSRPMSNALWLEERKHRQQKMLAMLQRIKAEGLGRDAVAVLLNRLFAENRESSDNPQRKAFFDGYGESVAQTMATVVNLTTPAQKAFAAKKLQSLIDDLNALAAEAR